MKLLGVDVGHSETEREPVLNIPAIDMTEGAATETRSAKPATPGASARRPNRKRGQKRGSVGHETYEAVEALVSSGTKKTHAFAEVARKTGRSTATVTTTYYRVARQQANPSGDGEGGASGRTRAPAPTAQAKANSRRPRTGGRRSSRQSSATSSTRGSEIEQLASQLVRSLSELAGAFRAQSQELTELRGRLDGMRDLLG